MVFTAKKLAKHISQAFKEPFVDADLVKCTVRDNGDFILRIGRRDIQIGADGELIGQGTRLLSGQDE